MTRTDKPGNRRLRPKVVLAHNLYQQPGGEDEVYRAEASLLEARGHQVIRYSLHSETIPKLGRLALAKAALWNSTVHRELGRVLREESPHLIHFHNTFPLISPSAYYAAREAGVPVVQSLHNYRLICPGGQLLRDSRPCELCVGKYLAWPGIVHSCYRQSRSATTVTAAMLAWHRVRKTWARAVNIYVALTEFSRHKFIEGGLPADRIMVKPNFLYVDPGLGNHAGEFALFVGRLSPEKGVHTLVKAWQQLSRGLPLKVVGDGPVRGAIGQSPANVEWLGYLPKDRVISLMKQAAFLILPSEWYESFPVTLLEAFATGLPVIASGHGALAEIVRDGGTGRLVRPGDAADLASKVEWALDHREEMSAMGRRARLEFEAKYSPERNYEMLMRIYLAARGGMGGPESYG